METKAVDIILLSKSSVKMYAIASSIEKYNNMHERKWTLKCVIKKDSLDSLDRPEQPVGEDETRQCAFLRIKTFLERDLNGLASPESVILSVENGISQDNSTGLWYDICVIEWWKGSVEEYQSLVSSVKVPIGAEHMRMYDDFCRITDGDNITFGKWITQHHPIFGTMEPRISEDNWMKTIAGIDRVNQISTGFEEMIAKCGII